MLATIMNCMYVSEIFRTEGMDTDVFTPFTCGTWTKLFSKDEAVNGLKAGKFVSSPEEQVIHIFQQI